MSVSPIHPEDLEQLGGRSDAATETVPEKVSSQGLIDPEDLIGQPEDTQGTQKSAWRLSSKWLVGGSIGLVFGLVALIVLSLFAGIFGARRQRVAATATGPSEVERLRAELERAEVEANRERARRLLDANSDSRLVEPVAEPTPAPEPAPIAEAPVPIPRTPAPAPVARTPPRPIVAPPPPRPAPRPAVPEVDPAQRWQELALGGVTSSVAALTVADAAMPPALPPTVPASAAPAQLEVERVVTPGTQGILNGKPPEPVVEPPPPATILPGTAIGAIQTQPVIYNSATNSAYSLSLIELSEPLLDDAGAEVLPTGTQLVVEVANVSVLSSRRALVKQWATQAIVAQENGRRKVIEIPPETVAVIGSEKDDGQLIARSVSSSGGGFGRTLALAALGAAREVGRVINRPESQVVTTGTFGSTVSTNNGDDDVLAAIISGAADPLLGRTQNNIQRDVNRRDPIFLIPADTPVTVTLEKTWQPNV